MPDQRSEEWTLKTLPASSLRKLLNRAGKLPSLTREEVIELFWRIRAGDEAAREKMILRNLRLVARVANYFYAKEVVFFSLDDLFSAGMGGLIRAVEMFDERKGFKFSTYAIWWIRQAVSAEIQRRKRPIAIPSYLDQELRALQKKRGDEEERQGRSVGAEEVLWEMGWGVKKEGQMREVLSRDTEGYLSLDRPTEGNRSETEETSPLGECVTANQEVERETIERLGLLEEAERYLEVLPERERQIVEMTFGLNGFQGHTLQKIGEELHISRQRASQILQRAMVVIRRTYGIQAPAPKRRRKSARREA